MFEPTHHFRTRVLSKTRLPSTFTRRLFDGFPEEKIQKIFQLGELREAKAGSTFFRQEDPATCFFYLESGRVKLYQVTHKGFEALLKLVVPGETFGAASLLRSGTYPACAEAAEDSRAIMWSGDVIHQIVRNEPDFAQNLTLLLVQAIDEFRERHVYRTTQRVEQRIAWALCTLARYSGQPNSGEISIPGESVQRDLADMAGTTIYTVSRVLSIWERAGTLTKSRSGIVLHSPDTLEQLAKLA
jgi:CRP-like cAMP-binding protein